MLHCCRGQVLGYFGFAVFEFVLFKVPLYSGQNQAGDTHIPLTL